MKLKTLNYIHNLLIENEERAANAKEIAEKAIDRAEREGADNIESLQNLGSEAYGDWRQAIAALEEFETQEW